MPTLRILTNVQVPAEDRASLLATASRALAELLGKPESYVMVMLEEGRDLYFAGSAAPAAYLEVKSLGLPESRTPDYSHALCDLVGTLIGALIEGVDLDTAQPPRQMISWNNGTL